VALTSFFCAIFALDAKTGGKCATYRSKKRPLRRSAQPVYSAGSGFQAVGAGAQLKYRFNPAWATYGFVEYDKLVGPTANSPIVTGPGGSANQWTVGLGLTYSFVMIGLPF